MATDGSIVLYEINNFNTKLINYLFDKLLVIVSRIVGNVYLLVCFDDEYCTLHEQMMEDACTMTQKYGTINHVRTEVNTEDTFQECIEWIYSAN
ncbi:Maph33 [Matsumuraeses phaseoli granulovirus]|uniref:Maph33 n=1 Tax=Matsumuraeses phaseoli granulovirus TaxID=2760664 RepID=A0AAE7MLC6_9BBAC|nr:Maph33 [Matsumuraeses phaseoli granulovirus]QOD39996.1 Maph33 [Matsumuraeses phaseoli granulovirus]